ncbi:MAG: radical SAM protein [Deltaproteobacteria bacterium]|nr:radical SAM protein [Deltaproteobacteria bacterium]
MFNYQPERILIDSAVSKEPLTRQICSRFPNVPTYEVKNYNWHKDSSANDPLKNPLSQGKKTLHLKQFKGKSIKACPGFSDNLVCCNYFTLDLIENCPFECTYCILQAFLNKPVITVHANLEDILKQVWQITSAQPETLFRIGTGEHSDSLALDKTFGINQHVIKFFSNIPNALLELKTKSNHVEHLLELPHGGKTVISWSVNPQEIIKKEEHKTATLDERLKAAKMASDAGYKVAFHFDPMIDYPDWEKGYQRLVEQIVDNVSSDRIAWISFGTLRYISSLKSIVDERFPNSRVFLGEFIPGVDGKMRYLKKIRQRLYRNVQNKVEKLAPDVPTYLCMESSHLWEKSMPNSPKTSPEMEGVLLRSLEKRYTKETKCLI